MEYKIKIQRGYTEKGKPVYQNFTMEIDSKATVADVLTRLNAREILTDAEGNPAEKIAWDCSCLQGMCGACSMIINGVPALACKTLLASLKGDEVVLEPLSKFTLIKDLSVDRSALHEIPIELGITREGDADFSRKNYDLMYEAAKCLKCGLCVEVCPNSGPDRSFAGAFLAADCYLERVQTPDKVHEKDVRKAYNKNFGKYCSKDLSCQKVCPAGIDFTKLIARMNKRIKK